MSYLDTAKKVKAEFRKSREGQFEPIATDITEGHIVALEICSNVLEAHIWFAFDDDFNPGDGQAVFYASEFDFLKSKTPEQLREIHKSKLTFGPGTRVRQQ